MTLPRVPAGTGYDPEFLITPLAFPSTPDEVVTVDLPFTHFSVLLQPARRLAVATGVNIDGAQLLEIDRGDDWHLDPRVPVAAQTGPEVYDRNDLDRGHLVRRRDPVWGPAETASQANFDSFTYVNAAPQAGQFNQDETLWAGLENYILDHARVYGQRLSVFTAPVLDPEDPPYRGVQIPRLFWKVAAWASHPGDGADVDPADLTLADLRLAATGYLLDQTPQLDDIELATVRALQAGDPPPLGPFRTYQVPIVDIAALTGLDLGPLVAADRLAAPVPRAASRQRWIHLDSYADVRL